AKQALILNVTLNYLQVLNAQDLVKLAKARVTTTQGQLDRLKSLYEEETGNPAEYRDLQGQMAADASNNGVSNSVDYIISKNNFDNAQINLANVVYEYIFRVRVLEYYRVGL